MPRNVLVVGFDNIPEAAHFTPPLSTVRQDFTDLGRCLMATVSDVLDGRAVTQPVKTSPHLVVREAAARVVG